MPELVLVSHFPIEHDKAVCASIYNAFVGPHRVADLAGFHELRTSTIDFARSLETTLTEGRTLVINGMTALLTHNGVYALRQALANNNPVIIYWHETAWNLRFLSNRHRPQFVEVRTLLPVLNVTHWVTGVAGQHLIAYLFGTPMERIRVVRECVDLTKFTPAPRRRCPDPDTGAFVVAGAGVPCLRKGTDLFCRVTLGLGEDASARGLAGIEPRWYAATPGNTGYKQACVPTSHVRWMGCAEDFASELAKIDVLLMTSRDDPCPLVALEALATDRPVFCFPSVGTAELLPREFVCESPAVMHRRVLDYLDNQGRYPPGFFRAIAEDLGPERFAERAFGPMWAAPEGVSDAAMPVVEDQVDELKALYEKIRRLQSVSASAERFKREQQDLSRVAAERKEALLRAQSGMRQRDREIARLRTRPPISVPNRFHPTRKGLPDHPKKVVVVGNAPSVLEHGAGKLIDACDEVIRINNFQIDGYETHVGSKTTRAVFSFACKPNPVLKELTPERRMLFRASKFRDDRWIDKRMSQRDGCGLKVSECTKLCTSLYYDGLRELAGLPAGSWATTGLVAIRWAIDRFGHEADILVHGFSFYRESGEVLKRYYPVDTKRDGKHDFEAEARYCRTLLASGEIRELVAGSVPS